MRRLIKQDFTACFEQVDVIAGPTTPGPAFALGEIRRPVAMYLEDIYTLAVNLAGLPGMSIPAGFVDGKPVAQLIGPPLRRGRSCSMSPTVTNSRQTGTCSARQAYQRWPPDAMGDRDRA